jgi:hypothetical protein
MGCEQRARTAISEASTFAKGYGGTRWRVKRDFLISGEKPEIKKFQACGASVLNGNGFFYRSLNGK